MLGCISMYVSYQYEDIHATYCIQVYFKKAKLSPFSHAWQTQTSQYTVDICIFITWPYIHFCMHFRGDLLDLWIQAHHYIRNHRHHHTPEIPQKQHRKRKKKCNTLPLGRIHLLTRPSNSSTAMCREASKPAVRTEPVTLAWLLCHAFPIQLHSCRSASSNASQQQEILITGFI